MRLSLRWTIQAWHALVLVGLVSLLGTLFYFYERSRLNNALNQTLYQQVHPLSHFAAVSEGLMPPAPSLPPLREAEERMPRTLPGGWVSMKPQNFVTSPPSQTNNVYEVFEEMFEPLGFYASVWNRRTGRLLFRSERSPFAEPPQISEPGLWIRTSKERNRELIHKTPRMIVLLGHNLASLHSSLALLRWQLVGGGILIVTAGLLVGGWLVSRSLRPLGAIEQTAADIARGRLAERVPDVHTRGGSELAALAESLNRTFAQMEKLFLRQVQFTADASHELRTPLTALITQIDLGRGRERSVSEHEAILEVCRRSVARIKRITDDLLELSHFDSGRIELECERLPLDTLIAEMIEELRPMVAEKGCTLTGQPGAVEVACDPFRIEQVVTNLIFNAMQHNPQPVDIVVSTRSEDGWAVIEVSDNGCGIPAKHGDHLFERFYRESASRTRRDDGSSHHNVGLGLAISKAIVDAHGGSLSLRSEPGKMTTFTIRLPLDGKNDFRTIRENKSPV